jgi:drug/metabolite transporter (DMT)-like permease
MLHLSTRKKAIIALMIANIIWGGASPIFKYSLVSIPPFTLAFLRFSIATILLYPFVYKEFRSFKNEVGSWKEILLYALSGVTFNIIFFFLGLQLTQSINAPILASGGPIVTIILAHMFLGEKFKLVKIIGGIVSFFGIMVIILQPLLDFKFDGSIIGNTFLILATLGATVQTLVGKKVFKKYPPLPLTFWAFLIGAISFIPFALPELATLHIDTRGLVGIVYGAVFSSFIAYSLFAWGLSKIEASEAGIFAYIDPIVAIAIAYPLLGEKPTPVFLLGSILVFAGIFIAEKRIHYYPILKLLKREINLPQQ